MLLGTGAQDREGPSPPLLALGRDWRGGLHAGPSRFLRLRPRPRLQLFVQNDGNRLHLIHTVHLIHEVCLNAVLSLSPWNSHSVPLLQR